MKTTLKIPAIIFLCLLFFNCKNKELSELEYSKLVMDLKKELADEDTLGINLIELKVEKKNNNQLARVTNNNLPEFELRIDTFNCGGCDTTYRHFISTIIPPIAHTVTSGKPPLSLVVLNSPNPNLNKTQSNSNISYRNRNSYFFVEEASNVLFYANFDIKVPSNKFSSLQKNLNIIVKFFMNSIEFTPDKINISSIILKPKQNGTKEILRQPLTIQESIVELDLTAMSECDSHHCIKLSVEGEKVIRYNNKLNSSISIGFQIQNDDTLAHNNHISGNSFESKAINDFVAKFKNPNLTNLPDIRKLMADVCYKIPETLQDFEAADNSNCGHIADHTMITTIPITQLSAPLKSNIGSPSPNNTTTKPADQIEKQ